MACKSLLLLVLCATAAVLVAVEARELKLERTITKCRTYGKDPLAQRYHQQPLLLQVGSLINSDGTCIHSNLLATDNIRGSLCIV